MTLYVIRHAEQETEREAQMGFSNSGSGGSGRPVNKPEVATTTRRDA